MNTELKPYLIRAIYDWCHDHGFTPHIVAHVNTYTRVPPQYVRDQEIMLNIGVNACDKLVLGNEFIEFSARFGGKPFAVSIPVGHIVSIFARENGEGMGFEIQPYTPDAQQDSTLDNTATDTPPETPKSGLKIVKKQD